MRFAICLVNYVKRLKYCRYFTEQIEYIRCQYINITKTYLCIFLYNNVKNWFRIFDKCVRKILHFSANFKTTTRSITN